MKKVERNAPCPCGSGKKYKQCCLKRDAALASSKHAVSNVLQQAIEHHQAGHLPQAETLYRQILQAEPNHADALHFLGMLAFQLGSNEIAIELIGNALSINPNSVEAHSNLGGILQNQGRLDEAFAHFHMALSLQPDYAEAHNNLGNVLKDQGRLDEAAGHFHAALSLKPNFAEAHSNLGNARQAQGRLDEAVQHFHAALSLKPDFIVAHNNLGNTLQAQGKLNEAAERYRGALSINPTFADVHSNLLFCLTHNKDLETNALFAEHVRFGEQFEAPLRSYWPQHTQSKNPDRCLQIGFVSGDFFEHAVANFIEPVLAHLAGYPQLSLHAYANNVIDDSTTRRVREHFAHWHTIVGLSDDVLAQKIRDDNIDILIDLSGHTCRNRLLTVARKPSPVQASWMGYPGTTGLRAMDYYLADRFLLPTRFEDQYTEKIVRLPANAPFLPSKDAPPVNTLPALGNGNLTFGSFNRLSKLNRLVVALWSQLLRALPDSKMVLGGLPQDGKYDTLIEWFAEEGIKQERLSLHPFSDMKSYLDLHQQVDICLDTFPYNGGTTTQHALWMGVPTLTLTGKTAASRQGAAILGHVGLDDFIAHSSTEFVQKGLSLADNLAALSDIRCGLHERFAQSVMSQPALIAAGLERALRIMWQRWCAGLPTESFEVNLQEISNATE